MSEEKRSQIITLPYALNLLVKGFPFPFHLFDKGGNYLQHFDSADNWNILHTDPQFRKVIIEEIKQKQVTIINHERPVIFGGVVAKDNITVVVGPLLLEPVIPNFSKIYANKHHADDVVLKTVEPEKLAAVLLLIYSTITGNQINLNQFLDDNLLSECFTKSYHNRVSTVLSKYFYENRPHNPEVFEQNIINAIKSGNVEQLNKSLASPFASMRGTVALNELRNAKNLAIVDITIATRAAISVGVSAEYIYTLSDSFILEVEDAKQPYEAHAVYRACAVLCAQIVNNLLAEQNRTQDQLINLAIEEINRHLYEKINVQELCDTLHVSKSYLSHKFKDVTGQTIVSYILTKKVEIAKDLLINTNKSINEIASLLSFCSQSHFGQVFIKYTKKTPFNFRKTNSKMLINL